MTPRKIHKIAGLILVLPFIGWIITGLIFLTKPGYDGAYQQIAPKVYPIEQGFTVNTQPGWLELNIKRTILGYHLLVKQGSETLHLDAQNLAIFPQPSESDIILLLEDAIAINRERYGIISPNNTERHSQGLNSTYVTTTGVELTLDWNTLSIRQRGLDTKIINTLYKIHYLQWLGQRQINLALGVLGLLGLTLLVYYGVVIVVKGNKHRRV